MVNPELKGGDVDLQLALGERKIDIIITDNPEKTEFTKTAYKYGVEI